MLVVRRWSTCQTSQSLQRVGCRFHVGGGKHLLPRMLQLFPDLKMVLIFSAEDSHDNDPPPPTTSHLFGSFALQLRSAYGLDCLVLGVPGSLDSGRGCTLQSAVGLYLGSYGGPREELFLMSKVLGALAPASGTSGIRDV